MKLIIIRALISIFSLLLSYLASLAVASLNLPVLLVFSFIISQCINECLSSSIKEKNDADLKEKDDEIQSLKERIHAHYNKLDNIYDSSKIPTKEKKEIKALKGDMLTSITYKHSGTNEKPKESPQRERDKDLQKIGDGKVKELASI
ncbi:hypothetical protein EKN60_23185 [Enterobacter hormaechei]|uniref:hypothetical protein n=1 Tax=Enterobacter hormaechei TaxID=158836 RepID=UPI000F8495EA|nr:hypothetical protein [Enterobacter hormaechei]RTO79876.1 hypothetical protein EKN60_23185 [Enterobacter hormaechei]